MTSPEVPLIAEYVAPIYRTCDWFVCGWCGSNMGEEWVEVHRESHRHRLEQLAQLAQYDGADDGR